MTAKISEVSGLHGREFTLVEYGTSGWIKLTAVGSVLQCDVSLKAISLAPDSDMDSFHVSYPDFILGLGSSPPQQTVRVGVGSPLLGRLDAMPAVNNGTIDIGPIRTIDDPGFAAFFNGALFITQPKLKVHLWFQYSPGLIPSRRTDVVQFGILSGDTTEQIMFRVGAWGRRVVHVLASGANGTTVRVRPYLLDSSGGAQAGPLLGSAVLAANYAEIGPFENRFSDVIEVTVQTGVLGNLIRVELRMTD